MWQQTFLELLVGSCLPFSYLQDLSFSSAQNPYGSFFTFKRIIQKPSASAKSLSASVDTNASFCLYCYRFLMGFNGNQENTFFPIKNSAVLSN